MARPKGPRGRGGPTNTGGGFTAAQAGGRAAHQEAVRNARSAERIWRRRQKAWRLFTGGTLPSFEAIGKACGVSPAQAWIDCKAYFAELKAGGIQDDELLRARIQAEGHAVRRAHLPLAVGKGRRKPDATSAQIVLANQTQERRLYGLDLRKQPNLAELVLPYLAQFTRLFLEVVRDAETRAVLAARVRQHLGPMAGRVLDAVPSEEAKPL